MDAVPADVKLIRISLSIVRRAAADVGTFSNGSFCPYFFS